MTAADLVNGLFEAAGSVAVWINVYRLVKDKAVKGVYWPLWLVYAAWGYWNLYYYPSLGQWVSFLGGIGVVLGNTAWVILAIYYTRQTRLHASAPAGTGKIEVPDIARLCVHAEFDEQLLCKGCGCCAMDLEAAGDLPGNRVRITLS